MCACDWNFLCAQHRGTTADPAYLLDGDEPSREQREREEEARLWMVQQTPGVKR